MNKFKVYFLTLTLASLALVFNACDDDDEEFFDRPGIEASAGSNFSVVTGNQAVVTFAVDVPGGYASATTSTGTITSEPAAGATSGDVVVTVVPASAGTTTITLTVTDQQQNSSSTTVAVVATDPVAGAPVIEGIPATASITAGDTLSVPNVTLTAEAGLASLTVQVDGTEIINMDLSSETSPLTVPLFEAPQTANLAAGNYVILFTLTDQDGNSTNFQHVLTVNMANVVVVDNNITENTTWETGTVYELAGRIIVESPAELTIQPGVVIKGQGGTGANASALVIARGAKIFANGNANSPVIFTSVADQIQPGQIVSPNLPPTQNGLWGGLIVLGNAPISVGGNAESAQIEGIPPSDTNGLYGGTDPDDNSGSITYISIRHGGANIGEGNEINGLTLGGVGSGTVINYVEVIANQDDGIEWFGGTVDVQNALVWNAGDDAIDTDQDWIGTLNNFIVVAGEDTDHALELDGPEGDQRTTLGHTLINGTIKGSTNAELGNLRDSVEVTISNVYFFGFPSPSADNNGDGQADGRGDFTINNIPVPDDPEDSPDLTIENYTTNGTIVLSSLEVALPDNTTIEQVFRGGTDQNATAVTTPTVGASLAPFQGGWSWAEVAGGLSDF